MDGDRRIPYGGSLGCLPDLLLLGFGFVFGSISSSFAPARYLCGIPSAPASCMIAVSTSPHDSCMIAA